MDCLFCKILSGEIPGDKVYEDEGVFAFRDIHPQAPTHVLIVPKKHMESILECDKETMARVLQAVKQIAQAEGISASGFRVVNNCGRDGRQSVKHLHFHLLGGAELSESMA